MLVTEFRFSFNIDFTAYSRSIQHYLTAVCYYYNTREKQPNKSLVMRIADAAASPGIKPTALRILESQKVSFPWAWFKRRTTPKTIEERLRKIKRNKIHYGS